MAKQEAISLESIIKDIRAKKYYPVYYLMGEEDYYIDKVSDFLSDNVLTEEEKEFNQTVIYATPDTQMGDIISAAKRYPMMCEHQVIIVKEAQNIKADQFDLLTFYLQKPLSSTLLVFCHKHGVMDRRKKPMVMMEKMGLVYESKRLKETQLIPFINNFLKRKSITIEPTAAEMMAEFIGSDLSRLSGELEKLSLTLPKGEMRISAALVEHNIGISKEYNVFELKNALIEKNVLKANQIARYFADNPKKYPLVKTLGLLGSFFTNLMLAYYAPEKSENGVAAQLNMKSPWGAKDYLKAMQRYSGVKVMNIISEIRQYDAKLKGVEGTSGIKEGDMLIELIYKILH